MKTIIILRFLKGMAIAFLEKKAIAKKVIELTIIKVAQAPKYEYLGIKSKFNPTLTIDANTQIKDLTFTYFKNKKHHSTTLIILRR